MGILQQRLSIRQCSRQRQAENQTTRCRQGPKGHHEPNPTRDKLKQCELKQQDFLDLQLLSILFPMQFSNQDQMH